MTLEIMPGKSQELLEALRNELPAAPNGPQDSTVYQGIGSPNRFCWHGLWDRGDALDAYLNSSPYRAVCGAARVLCVSYSIERCDNCQGPQTAVPEWRPAR